jgi:eukaryotic-like serine/threonine-protein kinase
MATSAVEDRLLDLLVQWDEIRRHGRHATAEELCSECPDLAEKLRDRIDALRGIDPVLDIEETALLSDPGNSDAERAADRKLPDCMHALATYRPQRYHARGGLGEVLAAQQEELGRLVALKRIQPERLHEGARKRFLREAAITAGLQHPGIVPIYGLGHDDQGPFYTMPLVDGQTLQEAIHDFHRDVTFKRVSGPGTLRFRALLQKFTAVCDTVAYAHDQGVIHRDLKPSNIMLGRYGETLVMDWGLAKHFGTADSDSEREMAAPSPSSSPDSLTATGAVLGTPQYMSPEQAKGLPTGPASDVFNLGLILYTILTGTPAFQQAGLAGGGPFKAVRDAAVLPPRQRDPHLPPALDAICLKALAAQPEDRYASARDLGKDIENWLADEPVSAWREPFSVRAGRSIRRRRTLVVSSTAVLSFGVAALACFTIVLTGKNQALRMAYRAEAEQRRAAQLNSAKILLSQGLASCGSGEITRGILWLARALEVTPRDDQETLGRTIRANLAGVAQQVRPLKAFFAHPDSMTGDVDCVIRSAAFSPNGRTVLTGCIDGTAQFWNADDGRAIGPPLPHRGSVDAVAFSRDGQTAATGSKDEVKLWNASTGKLLGVPVAHPSAVAAVAYSADGKSVVTAGADRNIRHWDTETHKLLSTSPIRKDLGLHKAAFSAKAETLLTSDPDNAVRIWNSTTGQQIGEPIHHEYQVTALGLSPDSLNVVTGDITGIGRVWDVIGKKQIGAMLIHPGTIGAVAFSPDGRTVMTGADDRTVRLWDTSTGAPQGAPLELQATVGAVAYSSDGTLLMAGQYGQVRLRAPVENRGTLRTFRHGPNWITAVAFSPDGNTVLTAGGNPSPLVPSQGLVWFWNRSTGQPQGDPIRYEHPVLAAAFSPDGTRLLTGCGYPYKNVGGAYLRSLIPGNHSIIKLEHEHNPVWSVAFSRDGRTVVTGSFDPINNEGDAKLWDAATGRCLRTIRHPRGGILAVAFSPDGETVLTGGFDRSARFWQASTGEIGGPTLAHRKEVFAVAFSPDGRTVLTGSMDGTARLWDRATGAQTGKALEHEGWVKALAFSRDGNAILTGGMDHRARLWQVTMGEAVTGLQFGPPVQHEHWVLSAAFSPDGGSILTGSRDMTACIQDLPRPVEGDPRRVTLWAQVMTGMMLDDGDVVRAMGVDEWKRCCDLLKSYDLGIGLANP